MLQHLYLLLFGSSGDNRSVVPLSQRDPSWASDKLAFSTHGQTIGSHGCTITCLAMLLNFVTPTAGYTPRTVNDILKSKAGYGWDAAHLDQNLVNWAALPLIFPQLKYNGKIECPNTPAPMNIVDALLLANNIPAIVYVDAEPLAGLQQHFILLTNKRTTTYDIANPWTGTMQTLNPQYGDTPAHAICGIVQLVVAV
jgi:hypothetical protein